MSLFFGFFNNTLNKILLFLLVFTIFNAFFLLNHLKHKNEILSRDMQIANLKIELGNVKMKHEIELTNNLVLIRNMEQKLQSVQKKADDQYFDAEKKLKIMRNDNARLRNAVRLYEARASNPDHQSANSASNFPSTRTPACQLSEETSRSLLDLAYDADQTSIYAQVCRDWVIDVSKILSESQKSSGENGKDSGR
jgi:hypothetical protein